MDVQAFPFSPKIGGDAEGLKTFHHVPRRLFAAPSSISGVDVSLRLTGRFALPIRTRRSRRSFPLSCFLYILTVEMWLYHNS